MLIIKGEKLRIALRTAGISQVKAAKMLGISRPTLMSRLNDKELDYDFVLKVKRVLQIDLESNNVAINPTSGDKSPPFESNSMLIGEVPGPGLETNAMPLGNNQWGLTIPLVPVKAYAGFLDNWGDPEYYEMLDKYHVTVVGNHHGEYLAFAVKGKSMENWTTEEMAKASIPENYIVTCRVLLKHHWRNKLHLHRWEYYVFVHKDGIITKQVIEHNVEEGWVIAHSLNPDKEMYPDFKIYFDDCAMILNVVQKGVAL